MVVILPPDQYAPPRQPYLVYHALTLCVDRLLVRGKALPVSPLAFFLFRLVYLYRYVDHTWFIVFYTNPCAAARLNMSGGSIVLLAFFLR